MYSFEYSKSTLIVHNNTNYTHFHFLKNELMQNSYENHKLICKKKYNSLFGHILNNVVNHFKKSDVVIAPNTFPYDFEPTISHYLIWSKTRLDNDSILNEIKLNIDCDLYDYLWFENTDQNKSVPEIFYVHLILRKKP